MRRLRFVLLVLVSALVLAACGSEPAAQAPTSAPEPTAAPRPTAKPKPTAKPEPTAEPVAELVTRPIEFGPLVDFTHPYGVFSIQHPENWDVQDTSSDTQATVVFSDPSGNGMVIASVIDQAVPQGESDLADAMRSYLETLFKGVKNLEIEDAVEQPDGSLRMDFSYEEDVNGQDVLFQGGGFVEQRGSLLSFLIDGAPSEQWKAVVEDLDKIINTYKIDTNASIAGGPGAGETVGVELGAESGEAGKLATVEIDGLETYTHDSGLFKVDVPSNWTMSDQSKPGEVLIVFTDPTRNAQIEMDIFNKPEGDLGEFLTTALESVYKDSTNLLLDEPQVQQSGSVLITFTYEVTVENVTATILGNSFISAHDDKAAVLTVLVPQEQFDGLQEPLNQIINSDEVDGSVALP
jgi:hypothetical protein